MTQSTAKGYRGMGMDGPIATWYAKNAKSDLKRYQATAKMVAGQVNPGDEILEVAPGPGLTAIELAKLGGYRVTGLDISDSFVEIARANAAQTGVAVSFEHGNASAMPFADNRFDVIYCEAAFKNFAEPVIALDEMYRVLKPGGQAVIMDLRKDASVHEIDDYVNAMRASWPNKIFMKWTFRSLLLKRAYTQADFTRMAAASKFGQCEVRLDQIGLQVWLNK
jgi:ubiquinone/menaquinone biosynthesis C-methylase UbiE